MWYGYSCTTVPNHHYLILTHPILTHVTLPYLTLPYSITPLTHPTLPHPNVSLLGVVWVLVHNGPQSSLGKGALDLFSWEGLQSLRVMKVWLQGVYVMSTMVSEGQY